EVPAHDLEKKGSTAGKRSIPRWRKARFMGASFTVSATRCSSRWPMTIALNRLQRRWQTISCLRYLKSSPSKSNLSNSRAQKNPFGVKGIGEAGTVPAAGAIVSGMEDALHDYGITIGEIPITPARLAELIRASSSAARK